MHCQQVCLRLYTYRLDEVCVSAGPSTAGEHTSRSCCVGLPTLHAPV